MISFAEIGHFALILAVGVALYQFVVPLWGAQRGDVAAMRAGISAAILQLLLGNIGSMRGAVDSADLGFQLHGLAVMRLERAKQLVGAAGGQ